jgi:putative heme iron utilization protein
MSVDNPAVSAAPDASEPGAAARRLIRTALKASLGTLDRTSGYPYVSLVLVATDPDGTPLLFISRLALHTQNLGVDVRASLLIDGTAGLGDPMTGGRLTLTGHARPTVSPTAKARFLARHVSARTYADFPDFAMYAFEITGCHYIGGFGRIVDLAPAQLVCSVASAPELTAAETDIVNHMNSDHADALELYATELAQCAPGSWRMCGIDPAGFDLFALQQNGPDRVSKPGVHPQRSPGGAYCISEEGPRPPECSCVTIALLPWTWSEIWFGRPSPCRVCVTSKHAAFGKLFASGSFA